MTNFLILNLVPCVLIGIDHIRETYVNVVVRAINLPGEMNPFYLYVVLFSLQDLEDGILQTNLEDLNPVDVAYDLSGGYAVTPEGNSWANSCSIRCY